MVARVREQADLLNASEVAEGHATTTLPSSHDQDAQHELLLGVVNPMDRLFIASVYLAILGRPADASGMHNARLGLQSGKSRIDYIRDVVSSEEARNKSYELTDLPLPVQKVLSHAPYVSWLGKIPLIRRWKTAILNQYLTYFVRISTEYRWAQERLRWNQATLDLLQKTQHALQVSVWAMQDRAQLKDILASQDAQYHGHHVLVSDRDLETFAQHLEQLESSVQHNDGKAEILLPLIKQAIDDTNSTLVLHLGCGQGQWAQFWQAAGCEMLCADPNPLNVSASLGLGLMNVHEQSAEYVLADLPNASCAVVVLSRRATAPRWSSWFASVREAARVLKPGGMCILEWPKLNADMAILEGSAIPLAHWQTLLKWHGLLEKNTGLMNASESKLSHYLVAERSRGGD